jgi:thiol-disulfide isomerase/thioredoxin
MSVIRSGAVAVLTLVGVLSACGGDGKASFEGVGNDGAVLATAKRQHAPELSGRRLDGQGRASTAANQGKVAVVNLWGSWCGPCKEEAPALAQVASEHPDVSFLGVDTRDVDSKAQAFEAKYAIPYPSIVDTDGSLTATWRPFPPTGTPVTVLLDHQGRVAARFLGKVSYADLTRTVTVLVSE